jgi:hypothetical protein
MTGIDGRMLQPTVPSTKERLAMNRERLILDGRALAVALAIAACEGNRQSMSVSGNAGNISQSQSGYGNSQSMTITGTDGNTPNVSQTQSGVNREQSLTIDGKKVESKGN